LRAADGARNWSPADIAIAITGVAGPEPDEDGNPVGLMCIALALRSGETISWECHYVGSDREENLRGVMADALESLLTALDHAEAASAGKARPSHRHVE
jgi:nicotinamide mononucleotide (NMN) deamidase PncC